jgi:hypothetical protein
MVVVVINLPIEARQTFFVAHPARRPEADVLLDREAVAVASLV